MASGTGMSVKVGGLEVGQIEENKEIRQEGLNYSDVI